MCLSGDEHHGFISTVWWDNDWRGEVLSWAWESHGLLLDPLQSCGVGLTFLRDLALKLSLFAPPR